MLVTIGYRRGRAVSYAERWAFSRNPLFEDYSGLGGDCTNFVSQAVYAGSCIMNYTPTFGWYYLSPDDRAPAWTGVEFFYRFITNNEGAGPFGTETYAGGLEMGDVVQLGMRDVDGFRFYHTLLVTGADEDGYLVTAHSDDAAGRPLSSYRYDRARFLHIEGVRMEIPDRYAPDCWRGLLEGRQL